MSSRQLIRVGHSPDPDDAFMFHALANDKIDTGRYQFTHELVDIETLNRRALKGELELTAVSLHGYAYMTDTYALCSCGASIGDNYGPMVVARQPGTVADMRGKTIAVPGTLTTAFLSMQLWLGQAGMKAVPKGAGHQPSAISHQPLGQAILPPSVDQPSTINHQPSLGHVEYIVVPFDEILNVVERGEVDAGLIIHEGQLTYHTQGLTLIEDMGVWWMRETGLPLPLGGNAIRKDLGQHAMEDVTALLKQSIEYGLQHRQEALTYAMQYGRDLDRAKSDRFVGMYVNDWTLDFGPRGREAVALLLQRGYEAGIIPNPVKLEFIG